MDPGGRHQAVQPILLAACGNAFAGDDGFGPLVLQIARRRLHGAPILLHNVELLDLSTNPSLLLDALPDRFALVLVDAVVMGKADRALVDVDCSDISSLPLALEATASTHGMDLGVGLKLAAQLSLIPCHARLILLTIDGARRGDLLSVRARQQAPLAAEAALRWCREYVDLWRLQSRLPRTLGKLPV